MMRSPHLLLAAILVLPAGCGGESSDSGPSSHEIFLVQRSASASGAISQVNEAASDGILASSSSGTSAPGPHAVPVFPGSTPSFDFAAAVDGVFDFDALDADGNDRFPNLTGQIHVTATGTETGTPEAGDATFSATVDTVTDVTRTDPDTGIETTLPAGGSWSYLLAVVWTLTDSDNWTVTATATSTIDVPDVTVDDGTTILTIDVLGQREVVSSFSREDGKPSHARSFEGSLVTTVDDGSTTETVTIVFDKPGKVWISLLGNHYGPLSEGEVGSLFNAAIQ